MGGLGGATTAGPPLTTTVCPATTVDPFAALFGRRKRAAFDLGALGITTTAGLDLGALLGGLGGTTTAGGLDLGALLGGMTAPTTSVDPCGVITEDPCPAGTTEDPFLALFGRKKREATNTYNPFAGSSGRRKREAFDLGALGITTTAGLDLGALLGGLGGTTTAGLDLGALLGGLGGTTTAGLDLGALLGGLGGTTANPCAGVTEDPCAATENPFAGLFGRKRRSAEAFDLGALGITTTAGLDLGALLGGLGGTTTADPFGFFLDDCPTEDPFLALFGRKKRDATTTLDPCDDGCPDVTTVLSKHFFTFTTTYNYIMFIIILSSNINYKLTKLQFPSIFSLQRHGCSNSDDFVQRRMLVLS